MIQDNNDHLAILLNINCKGSICKAIIYSSLILIYSDKTKFSQKCHSQYIELAAKLFNPLVILLFQASIQTYYNNNPPDQSHTQAMMHYCGFCQMLFRLLITNNVLLKAVDAKLFNPPMRGSLLCSVLLFALSVPISLIIKNYL